MKTLNSKKNEISVLNGQEIFEIKGGCYCWCKKKWEPMVISGGFTETTCKQFCEAGGGKMDRCDYGEKTRTSSSILGIQISSKQVV